MRAADRTASLIAGVSSVFVFFAIVVSMLFLQLVREVSADVWEILAYGQHTFAHQSGHMRTSELTSITDSTDYIQLTED